MTGSDRRMQQKVFGMCVHARANGKLHKNCIGKLNNAHLSGSDRCPKLAEAAMTHMLHCMDQNRRDELVDGIQLMQKKTTKCWLCQEEGHKANECPNRKKKEEPESKLKAARVKWHIPQLISNDNTSISIQQKCARRMSNRQTDRMWQVNL